MGDRHSPVRSLSSPFSFRHSPFRSLHPSGWDLSLHFEVWSACAAGRHQPHNTRSHRSRFAVANVLPSVRLPCNAGGPSVTTASAEACDSAAATNREDQRSAMGPALAVTAGGTEGLVYVLDNAAAIDALIEEFPYLELKNINHLLGITTEGVNTEQPRHVRFWQPLELVQYIRRVGCSDQSAIVPVVGGRGRGGVDHFLSEVALRRAD
eukprot:CAMPEP_0181170636 /NCGR_PEP_ID=MMETSP1096-20121128/1474_1 /TAXON_ID=156174 ORGANISM="Chrysochromulina ericina, Strain CCMP281" /NCGR_SAMPLE_ID=MMETSP1096 /ASSEMBLY_ACC=CAM_ASM_000453 /LENGTH=208 /DNA_ID=CAMNT_0023258215 /DNA_START=110 /DNA_END=734 /DNA_ORIENTATION=-